MNELPPAVARKVKALESVRATVTAAEQAAEEALTKHFESELLALSRRFPKRTIRASSGMGSLSIAISDPASNSDREYLWIWGVPTFDRGNDLFTRIAKAWESLLTDFSFATGIEYVNFSRDMKFKGGGLVP